MTLETLIVKAGRKLSALIDTPGSILGFGILCGLETTLLEDCKYPLQMWGFALSSGLFAEGLRYTWTKARMNSLKDDTNPALQVLDEDYYQGLVQDVKNRYFITGKLKATTANLRSLDGTYTLRGGYFTHLTLHFEDKDISLLIKYHDKPHHDVAAQWHEEMASIGIDFVPYRFHPKVHTRLDHLNPNRGIVYEWVEKDNLEGILQLGEINRVSRNEQLKGITNTIFSKLMKVYSSNLSIPWSSDYFSTLGSQPVQQSENRTFKFHQDLITKLGDNEFTQMLDQEYRANVQGRLVPIHGDLHQGNILGLGEKIIDWDNVQYGHPFHDFMHFSVLSDFDRHPGFMNQMNEFLQKEFELEKTGVLGPLGKDGHELLAFEVYSSLLHRYYTAVEQSSIIPEFHEGVLESCKYLEEQAQLMLELTGKEDLIHHFEEYRHTHYQKLDSIVANPSASVAYAHQANHRYRIIDKDANGLGNFQVHREKIEKQVYREEMRRSAVLANAGLNLSMLSLPVMSYFMTGNEKALQMLTDFIAEHWFMVSSVIIGAPSYVYHQERIHNFLFQKRGKAHGF